MDRIPDNELYLKTHGFLTFGLDLKRIDAGLWMLLGEARSKCGHIAGVPLRPATNHELHALYLAKGVHGTTAIEGNTLSEEEVLLHLQGELDLPPSQAYLIRELDNIVSAFNWARDLVLRGEAVLSAEFVAAINARVLDGLQLQGGVQPGRLRTHSVTVGPHYVAPPAASCQFLLARLCEWLNGSDFNPRTEFGVALDILKAIIAHLYLAWIHPFGDGNGRTARLVELIILMEAGIPTPAAHLLSNHYNKTRTEYYRLLEEARFSVAGVVAFIRYSVGGFVEQLAVQIQVIRSQQLEQAWEDLVNEQIGLDPSPPGQRQRLVALELGRSQDVVRKAVIPGMTPELREAYRGKTAKTLSRDIRSLLEMHLLVEEASGYRAAREAVSAFLPTRADSVHDSLARHPSHLTA